MTVRFIEYMENVHAEVDIKGMQSCELLEIIGSRYSYNDEGFDGHSPSHYYKLDNGYEFGIIEPHKDDFCAKCNRIRLTAEGNLIPCLYFDEATQSSQTGSHTRALCQDVHMVESILIPSFFT